MLGTGCPWCGPPGHSFPTHLLSPHAVQGAGTRASICQTWIVWRLQDSPNMGFLGRPLALTSPALPASSIAAGQEQRHASVPACAEVGMGGRSWQCCPAWQGSHGPDLSGFENTMGTRRTFVFRSGAGTGPSGCSWDVTASWLLCGGDNTPLRHPKRSRQPHCTLALFPFHPSVAEPKALPVFSCSHASWGCSPRATGGDEQLWQRDSLHLETPPAFTTAHVRGEPRGGQGVCAAARCKT